MTARRRLSTVAAISVLAVAVTACSPTMEFAPHSTLDRTPHTIGTPAPEGQDDDVKLPPLFDGQRLVDPGWAVPPQQMEGIYLAPRADDYRLVFTAVSEEGVVLWTAERPMLCSAFVVTTGTDGPLAILMDTTSGQSTVSDTTISAYHLDTGAKSWGPVEVPGPHLGPGLVFAAPPPESMGESGPRMAIDPTTGRTLASESEEEGVSILGENNGVVLLTEDAHLIARTAEESELWRLSSDEIGLPADGSVSTTGFEYVEDLVLIGDSASGAVLVNQATGAVAAHNAQDVVLDRSTGTSIVLGDELSALDSAGQKLWSHRVPAGSALLSAGSGVVYLSSVDGIHILDATSGESLMLLPSSSEVPREITEMGAGIIGSYEDPLLVTVRE